MSEILQLEPIRQVSRLPRSVETTAKNIETHFRATSELLLQTAIQLEDRAAKLREKAERLAEASSLADEVRGAVTFEQDAFAEVQSLALVSVGTRIEE